MKTISKLILVISCSLISNAYADCNSNCENVTQYCSAMCEKHSRDTSGNASGCIDNCYSISRSCYNKCETNEQSCAHNYYICLNNTQDPKKELNCMQTYKKCYS